eukprot:UN09300
MSQVDRCSICLQSPQQPILQTLCHHEFCAKCICRSLLESTTSIFCPNCRKILKSLTQVKIDSTKQLIRFNFKFKRVKFKVFVDMNEYKTFPKYLSYLLDINALRLKIIHKGKQCDDKSIMENINKAKNDKIEYMIIGSKQSIYTLKTRIKTEYAIRVNQAKYNWEFIRLSLISWFQSILHSIRNMTFGDIIEFIISSITFLFQLIILYFKSLCNPQIGR